MRAKKGWLLNALLVAGSVAATLAIAFGLDHWLHLGLSNAVATVLSRNVQEPEPIMYVYDNGTGWRLNPRTQYHRERSGPFLGLGNLERFDTRLRVNSEGFIDREHFLETPYYRIAFVGDSWVEAVQQEYGDRFAPLTEDYVFAQSDHRKAVEIMNFGVSNVAPAQAYGVIRGYVLKYRPNEVWLFVTGADIGSNSPVLSPPPFGPTFVYADGDRTSLADIRFGFVDPPAYANWKRERELGEYMRAAPALSRILPWFYSEERNAAFDRIWGDMRLTIGLVKKTLDTGGARMRMVYIPARYEIDASLWSAYRRNASRVAGHELPMDPGAGERRYAALAKELGIEFLSLAPLCREKGAREMFADHFTRMGHHWVAQHLAKVIVETTPAAIP